MKTDGKLNILKAATAPLLIVACLSLIRWQYGVLLFHSLAEIFSIIVGVLMLVIVWNTHRFTHNDFLVYLGIGYFWIAVLDTWHTLTVQGMPFFNTINAEITLHFWIYTRFIEALLLLSASLFLKRRLNTNLMFFAGASITLLVVWASFALKEPVMLTPEGLTPFKVNTEFFIITLLVVTIIFYIRQRELLAHKVLYFLLTSLVLTIFAELSFTLYTDFQGVPFVIGHLFKFLSFWMIYQAIVQTTLNEPFSVMAQASSSYDAIPHPAVVVDNQAVISQVNRAAEKISGKYAHQLVHKPIHEFFHPKHVPEKNCELCQAIKQGQSIEGRIVAFPEKQQWFLVSLSPIKVGDTSSGMVHAFTDITERKQVEEALRKSETHLLTLVETLPDLVWLKDSDGVYLTCNPKYERFFGAKKSLIVGKTDYDFVDKRLADYFREQDLAVIAAGKPSINEEEITYADDGHREILETINVPMYASDNKIIGVLGVGRDITERKETEQALRRAQKMDAIGQLTGGIAHDFNNILSIILGNLNLLERQMLTDDKSHKRIINIKKSAQRASDLTRQLLGFSRRQAAHLSFTDISLVIGDMDSLITHSVTPEVEVDHQFADDLWLTEIDRGDFEDALLNLILNARDAMPSGGRLILETRNHTLDAAYCALNPGVTPGEYVQLSVSDSGSGIPPEHQERIFEPFFTTKQREKGTGLGLALVYGFVKRSGGSIKVYSEQEIGTTFRIYLPRAVGEGQADRQNGEQDQTQPRGTELLLVVDDETDLLELAKESLEALGYQVLTAGNGQQALERLAAEPAIDLLFSDVVMPGGMNGYELAEQATAQRPNIKVLLTSGYTEKAAAHNGQAHFSGNLLSKPYSQAELAQRLRSLLDNKELTDPGQIPV